MELPNLPTDNLYKFLALAGTALTILFLTYPHFKMVELKVRVNSLSTEVAILKLRREHLTQAADRQSRMAGAKELKIDAEKVDGKLKEVSILLESIRYLTILQFIGFLVGSVMMVLGFNWWYLRVQKPADLNAKKK